MDEKHKADEIVHLNDLEFDEEEEEFSSFWYYDPTSARIEVSRNDIKKRRHLFQSPTNTWSIYVEYSENDVGVACFYDKEYENAVKCYVKFAEEEEDEDVDTEYNVFEALLQMTREDSKTYDFARSLYLKHFPGGSYSSKFVRSKSTPKPTPEEEESAPSLLEHDDGEDNAGGMLPVRIEKKERKKGDARIQPSAVVTNSSRSMEQEETVVVATKSTLTSREKEIRFLKKRLRQIQRLEQKPSGDLNDDQKVKLSKKSAYSRRLKMLTK